MTPQEIEALLPAVRRFSHGGIYEGAPLLDWGSRTPTKEQREIMRAHGFGRRIEKGGWVWVQLHYHDAEGERQLAVCLRALRDPQHWKETNLERGHRLHQSLEVKASSVTGRIVGAYEASHQKHWDSLHPQGEESLRGVFGEGFLSPDYSLIEADLCLDLLKKQGMVADTDLLEKLSGLTDENTELRSELDSLKKEYERQFAGFSVRERALRKENEHLKALDKMHSHEIEHYVARIKHLEGHIEVLKFEKGPSAAAQARPVQRGVVIHCQNDEEI